MFSYQKKHRSEHSQDHSSPSVPAEKIYAVNPAQLLDQNYYRYTDVNKGCLL